MGRFSRVFGTEGWDATDPTQWTHHVYKRSAVVGGIGGLGGVVGAVAGAAFGASVGVVYVTVALGIAAGLFVGGALWLRSENRRTQTSE